MAFFQSLLAGGLTLDAATGEIAGTPTESGTFQVAFHVTDSAGNQTSRTLTLEIDEDFEQRIGPSPMDQTVSINPLVAYQGRKFPPGCGDAPVSFSVPTNGHTVTWSNDGNVLAGSVSVSQDGSTSTFTVNDADLGWCIITATWDGNTAVAYLCEFAIEGGTEGGDVFSCDGSFIGLNFRLGDDPALRGGTWGLQQVSGPGNLSFDKVSDPNFNQGIELKADKPGYYNAWLTYSPPDSGGAIARFDCSRHFVKFDKEMKFKYSRAYINGRTPGPTDVIMWPKCPDILTVPTGTTVYFEVAAVPSDPLTFGQWLPVGLMELADPCSAWGWPSYWNDGGLFLPNDMRLYLGERTFTQATTQTEKYTPVEYKVYDGDQASTPKVVNPFGTRARVFDSQMKVRRPAGVARDGTRYVEDPGPEDSSLTLTTYEGADPKLAGMGEQADIVVRIAPRLSGAPLFVRFSSGGSHGAKLGDGTKTEVPVSPGIDDTWDGGQSRYGVVKYTAGSVPGDTVTVELLTSEEIDPDRTWVLATATITQHKRGKVIPNTAKPSETPGGPRSGEPGSGAAGQGCFAPTLQNSGDFFVSPAYLKGNKDADAVDVLWRYAPNDEDPDPEWTSIAGTGGESIVADKWWCTLIPLDYKINNGIDADDIAKWRSVDIEVKSRYADDTCSAVTQETLVWKLTEIGDHDHLIMAGEKMIITGPLTPPKVAASKMSLRIKDQEEHVYLQSAYNADTPLYSIVHFGDVNGPCPNVGHWTLTARAICNDNGEDLIQPLQSTIHVIKPRVIQAVSWWSGDSLPWTYDDWDIVDDDVWTALNAPNPWNFIVPAGANWVLYLNPTDGSYTDWPDIQYSIKSGSAPQPPHGWNGMSDMTHMWWTPNLTSVEDQVVFLVEYKGLRLERDRYDQNADDDQKRSLVGSAVVPGLSKYTYKVVGKAVTAISWSVDSPSVSMDNRGQDKACILSFPNDAIVVNLVAQYEDGGESKQATVTIVVVKVEVQEPQFAKDDKVGLIPIPAGVADLPAQFVPPEQDYVTRAPLGSDWDAFHYLGKYQAAEPMIRIDSICGNGKPGNEGKYAWKATCGVRLTAPLGRERAIEKLEVGFVQQGSASECFATYGDKRIRTGRTPAKAKNLGLDWFSNPFTGPDPNTDQWPWYEPMHAMQKGQAVAEGKSWTTTPPLVMEDSPRVLFPSQWNPNGNDPNKNAVIVNGKCTEEFRIKVAVHTVDGPKEAQNHYFEYASALVTLSVTFPLPADGGSIVRLPDKNRWTKPDAATEIDVNITPHVILFGTGPRGYRMWIPSLEK